MAQKVLTELKDGILIVTINREERRNCIDTETAIAMENIFNEAEENPEVKVIILTAVGDKCFCAGEDLVEYRETEACTTDMAHGFAGLSWRNSKKVIIAAINGAAVAGGLELALACDILIASEGARFGLTEVKVGLFAEDAVYQLRSIPKNLAKELVLTGNLIPARRAYEIGLINHVVPRDQLLDKAMEIAQRIAANAPLAVQMSKELLEICPQMSIDNGRTVSIRYFQQICNSEDSVEGATAFVEKRKPEWKGR